LGVEATTSISGLFLTLVVDLRSDILDFFSFSELDFLPRALRGFESSEFSAFRSAESS